VYTLCSSLKCLLVVLSGRVNSNVPLHDLVPSTLSWGLFSLTLVCGKTHLCTEGRLSLVDTAYFVSFWTLVSTGCAYICLDPDLFPRISYGKRQQ